MKRFFSLLLVITLVASMVIPTVAEASSYNDYLGIDESEYDMEAFYQDIWEIYKSNTAAVWNAVCGDEQYLYIKLADYVGGNAWFDFGMRWTEQELTKYRYAEILVNLMALMDLSTHEMIEQQVEYDTLKDFMDYASDVGNILAGTVTLSNAFGSDVTKAMEAIGTAMGLTTGAADLTINTIEAYQYMNWTIRSYEQHDLFLSTIIDNTNNENLMAAATELSSLVNKVFYCRMNAATDITEGTALYLGKDVFFDTILLEGMLVNKDILDLSDSGFEILNLCKNAYTVLSSAASYIQDWSVFISDMLGGSSDVMNRCSEMVALTEIRRLLVRKVEAYCEKARSGKDYEYIDKISVLMEDIACINFRGEYCAHEMLVHDGQVFSLTVQINGLAASYDEVFDRIEQYTPAYIDIVNAFSAEIIANYQRETVEPDADKSFLTEGYWVNSIQCHMIYKFLDDGTYYAYYYDPTQEIAEDHFQLSYSAKYIFDGNALTLIFDSGSEINLELVTTDSPVDWDGGLSNQINAIPDGVPFFYETGWIPSGYISENAMYLTRIKVPTEDQETGTILTFNGHKYQLFDGVCDSWENAKAYCENLGGYLATISTQEENDAIYTWITSLEYKNAYFGLTDHTNEGTWQWVSGEVAEYTNWHSGEPNSENANEDYAMFYYKFKDGTWNDGNFGSGTVSDQKVFICEWDSTSGNSSVISLDELTIIAESHYTGNMGDSRIFNLNGNGLIGNDNIGYRNGNESLGGSLLENGFEVWIARWNFGDNISWVSATFDLKNQYVKLTGKTDVIKSCNTTSYDATIYFYDGDILLASYRITPDYYQMTIDVDVSNVKELTILVKDNIEAVGGTSFALYDMFFRLAQKLQICFNLI